FDLSEPSRAHKAQRSDELRGSQQIRAAPGSGPDCPRGCWGTIVEVKKDVGELRRSISWAAPAWAAPVEPIVDPQLDQLDEGLHGLQPAAHVLQPVFACWHEHQTSGGEHGNVGSHDRKALRKVCCGGPPEAR